MYIWHFIIWSQFIFILTFYFISYIPCFYHSRLFPALKPEIFLFTCFFLYSRRSFSNISASKIPITPWSQVHLPNSLWSLIWFCIWRIASPYCHSPLLMPVTLTLLSCCLVNCPMFVPLSCSCARRTPPPQHLRIYLAHSRYLISTPWLGFN